MNAVGDNLFGHELILFSVLIEVIWRDDRIFSKGGNKYWLCRLMLDNLIIC